MLNRPCYSSVALALGELSIIVFKHNSDLLRSAMPPKTIMAHGLVLWVWRTDGEPGAPAMGVVREGYDKENSDHDRILNKELLCLYAYSLYFK